MTRQIWIVLFAIIFATSGFSELTLPSVFTDHMVLQRELPVPVWGKTDPGATVTVEFAGQKKSAAAAEDGKWRVDLDPMAASAGAQTMTISSGSQKIQISDVLIGEVWFCSGQSNMRFPLSAAENAKETIAAADYPLIRVFDAKKIASVQPAELVNARWVLCSPQTAGGFSGVAYFFGRKLHQDLNVPVGLMTSAWGGSYIEPWTPAIGFEGIDSLADIREQLKNPPDPKAKLLHRFPTTIFNGMVYESIPYAIRGVIWYQGEANHTDGMLYVDKSKALINGWRNAWGYDFPFYLVQIAPFEYNAESSQILPEFWEAQSEVVKQIPNTGMVVIHDAATSDNIHPPNKEVPGVRLALLAEAKTYGMDVVGTGPAFQTLEKLDGELKVNFDSAEGLTTRDGKDPDWFEIAGKDGVFKSATAEIKGTTVILSSPDVSHPQAVRFGWNKTASPNLINGAGLPASAFRAIVN